LWLCGNDFADKDQANLTTRFIMKQLFLTAFASLFFLVGNQAQTYQDTTFTDPVFITFANDFVTFKNCRFIGIDGVALWIEGSGALVSNCTFEDINGTAIFTYSSEVYLVEDTIRNANIGVQGEFGAVIMLNCQISQILGTAIKLLSMDVGEINTCSIQDVGVGIHAIGVNAGNSELLIVNNDFHRVLTDSLELDNGNAIYAAIFQSIKIIDCTFDSCMQVPRPYLTALIDLASIGAADIQGNTITSTNLNGILGRSQVNNAVIQNNEISHVNFLSGLPIYGINWQGPDARIIGNTIHHIVDSNGAGIFVHSSATITGNKIFDCTGGGILYRVDFLAGIEPLSIFNNIIYDVSGSPVRYLGGIPFPASGSEPISTLVRNNTLHSTQSAPLLIDGNQSPISAEGNILILEGEIDLTKFVQNIGGGALNDQLNIKAPGDLEFVDFAGRNFHLASENSPAYNALPLNFGLPNDDFDGDLRLGLRDAGADELVSGEIVCGCNNCPNDIPNLFFGDFNFSVLNADKNDLAASNQGVCGVRVAFEHEYIGDISMDLISPAGQSVRLIGPSGFWGSTALTAWNVGFVPCGYPASPDPGFTATWNSNQTWGESGAYSGVYYPASGCLEDFNLGTVTGDWTLRVFDNQADDNGSVIGFEVTFCNLSGVSCFACSEPPKALFTPNPIGGWAVSLSNESTGGVTNVFIDFGDGQTESGQIFQTFHEYDNAGSYLVKLIATNDCGKDTFTQMVQIVGELPSAFAYADPNEGCSPLELKPVVISADHVDIWHWFFPGGTPSESFQMEPLVTYATPGVYFATLILENEVGSVTLSDLFTVLVKFGLGNPSFTTQVIGDSIICTNTTQNSVSYYWTLDGGAAVGANTSPYVFEVNSSGNYVVGLSVTGICDTIFMENEVPVIIVSSLNLEQEAWRFAVSPNPNAGQFSLTMHATENLPADLSIINALGVSVLTQKIAVTKGENRYDFDLEQLPSGVYYLQIQTVKGRANLRLVIG